MRKGHPLSPNSKIRGKEAMQRIKNFRNYIKKNPLNRSGCTRTNGGRGDETHPYTNPCPLSKVDDGIECIAERTPRSITGELTLIQLKSIRTYPSLEFRQFSSKCVICIDCLYALEEALGESVRA